MKIKINNIFNKIQNNKKNINIQKINILKRRNPKYTKQTNEGTKVDSDYKVENKEYRRRGAIDNKNTFEIFKKFISNFAVKRSYYILFIFMTILAVISVYTNFATYRGLNNESFAVFGNNDKTGDNQQVQSSIAEDLQDVNSNNIDTRNNTDGKNAAQSTNQSVALSTSIKKNNTVTETILPLNFSKPINGEIIKVYSVDKLLFSKTLESWKTHDGVDIKANLGESVKSIEKGIIEKVYEDSFLGMTVIIDHGQGYKSIYSNLDSNINVKEKQIVKKAVTIGKLGKTSIGEIKDDSHIHFMLMLNNKVIDPTSKIKF
jgi:murein DD-endopeptidase MepM/ murein hydrolase activator NlpD